MRKVSVMAWFMRTALAVLIVCLGVVALILILGRLANPNPSCLNIEGYETKILDPKTGNTFVVLNQPTVVPPDRELASAYSADGKRFARFDNLSQTGLRVSQQVSPPLGYDRRDLFFSNPFLSEILWSPDNQWIAYRWKGSDQKQYLAIADADGRERGFTTLDSLPGEETELDSWSADDNYIAIINQDGESGDGRIRFLSIPDLKLYDPGDLGKKVGSGCIGLQNVDPHLHCDPWSVQGHEAIYVIAKDGTSGSLIFLDLDRGSTKSFPLSSSATETLRISPDGKNVAIGVFSWSDPANPSSDGQLSVYNAYGMAKINISRVTFAGVVNADGPTIADITWSPDSKFFVYARHMPDGVPYMEIMLYRPDTGQNDEILTHLLEGNYYFAFSGDGKYLAVFDPYSASDKTIFLVQIDGYITRPVTADQQAFPAGWSNDGQLLAFTEGPDNYTGHVTVRVIDRDGNDIRHMDLPSVDNLVWTPCR